MPHSGIDGSKPVCGSPSLIAAYHALHRLLAPRHPPCALSSLTIRTRNCRVLTSILKPESSKDCGQPAAISVNTHCECVVGKLPLQSIQLSKSPPSPAFASLRLLRRGFGETSPQLSLRPRHLARQLNLSRADKPSSDLRLHRPAQQSTVATPGDLQVAGRRARQRSARLTKWRIPGSNR